MKYCLSSTLIGASIVLLNPQITNALPSEQVGEIAQGITVLIETTDKSDNGSGVIIQKQGNTYTVLTAAHVIANLNRKYEIVTSDKQRYQLDYSTVKKLPNKIDLAVVTFTSNNNYQIAKIGNSKEAKLGSKVYVAGFPKQNASRKFIDISFPPAGKITANATQVTDDGYTIGYSIPTLPGMSGGPLLNPQGELIGIHGRGEPANLDDIVDIKQSEVAYVKGNNNYAIPIYTFLRQASLVGVNLGITVPPLQVAQTPTAEDSYLKGIKNAQKGNHPQAILQFTQAIKSNPNYSEAYYNRGNAHLVLENYQEAINDFDQATKINPNYVDAYLSKRDIHTKLSKTARKIFNETQDADTKLSQRAWQISHETQAMLAEQHLFQLLMKTIKDDNPSRQKFITELRRQQLTDNKNSFN
ncbi:MAG: trypsin-like peptidase domain-containing protein [Cyanobacteria bacterium J06573_2]